MSDFQKNIAYDAVVDENPGPMASTAKSKLKKRSSSKPGSRSQEHQIAKARAELARRQRELGKIPTRGGPDGAGIFIRLLAEEKEIIDRAAFLEGKRPATWAREVMVERARKVVEVGPPP